jgi:uncharacterized membrane protein
MESKTKLFGHPIHPMLIVFPLGLLSIAVLFDVAHLMTGDELFSNAAFWNIAAGVVGGLAAAFLGFLDRLNIPAGTRASQVGNVVVGLFALSWLLRLGEPSYVPSAPAFALALVGVLLALVTAWVGGELVDRMGMGMAVGANVSAPGSLSGKPAQVAVVHVLDRDV